jgi:hypothetical protein
MRLHLLMIQDKEYIMINERKELLDYMDKHHNWYSYVIHPLKLPTCLGVLCYGGEPVNRFAFVRKTGQYQAFFLKFTTVPDPNKLLAMCVEGKLYKIVPALYPPGFGDNQYANVNLVFETDPMFIDEHKKVLAQDLRAIMSMK